LTGSQKKKRRESKNAERTRQTPIPTKGKLKPVQAKKVCFSCHETPKRKRGNERGTFGEVDTETKFKTGKGGNPNHICVTQQPRSEVKDLKKK